jgi:hypothetical protein
MKMKPKQNIKPKKYYINNWSCEHCEDCPAGEHGWDSGTSSICMSSFAPELLFSANDLTSESDKERPS